MATSVVILTSLGHVDGPRSLDGRTHDGTVGLAPHTGAPFSGTRWRRRTNGDVWTLECLGELPGNRFLDGRTHDGSVGLAPNAKRPFTGTRWRARKVGEGFTLECLGELPGNRFLDGRNHDGSIGLAPTTDSPFTGTLWKVGVRSPSRRGSRPTIERVARAAVGAGQTSSRLDRPLTTRRTVATT
jgi:hypothetical protein